MCLCLRAHYVFPAAHYQKCGGGGATLTQKGLSCGQHFPRCLTENKQTIKSFNFQSTNIIFRHKLSIWRRMKWWCAYFSARHLGECWSHDSSFCVNVSPTCIFGNVLPTNGLILPFLNFGPIFGMDRSDGYIYSIYGYMFIDHIWITWKCLG